MNPGSPLLRRIVRGCALYDLVVTLPFATPWTAEAVLGVLGQVHQALGLRGEAMPLFTPMHLFFVTLFGVLAVTWAVARIVQPGAFLGTVDTVARVPVSLWMLLALAHGATQVLVGFLVMELAGMVAQGAVLLGAVKRREGAASPVG